ncbi:MAG: hypothetical protein VX568_06035, partial [Actinomycetota bacterium]|nr:hypothetical protein [Actinomycetota bacterium]
GSVDACAGRGGLVVDREQADPASFVGRVDAGHQDSAQVQFGVRAHDRICSPIGVDAVFSGAVSARFVT